MESNLPFVSLWSGINHLGEEVLHLMNREAHLIVQIPKFGANLTAVEEFLPEITCVMPEPNSQTRWLLLLEPSLPQSWQNLRWEDMTLVGRQVSSQIMVVRNATWRNETVNNKSVWLLDLFPPDEFSFVSHLQSLIQLGTLRTARPVFLKEQMTASSDLIIMAHGREHGLIDASGSSFNLPIAHPMPERIWLLACNVNGALDSLAELLLKQGCCTVITATSDISAPEMARLIEDVFSSENTLFENVSWLTRTETAFKRVSKNCALTIWGNVDIDRSPCSEWNRLSWDNEHGAWRRIPLDDETSKGEYMMAHEHAMSLDAWHMTRKWMLSPLLWLAEKHHHPSMRQLSELIGDSKSPEAIRSLAAAARRVGNYVQTARCLSHGLNLPDLSVKERAEYLGALANLFIDLDLPESAAAATELHENCNLDDPKDRAEAEFRRLDWMARTEARRGHLHIALDLMTAKRKLAEFDTGRELAWQLYLSTWGYIAAQVPMDAAAAFADEVEDCLAGVLPQEVGYGNETTAYLLRALAAHAWATNDVERLNIPRVWLQHAEDRLADDDPGPWAYTIAYMYFQRAAPLMSFDRAISALERARYYLEAASLSGFADYAHNSKRLLSRFQRRRNDILAELNDNAEAYASSALAELASRAKTETEADFLPINVAHLGTLPL